jgi:hypothetical protein
MAKNKELAFHIQRVAAQLGIDPVDLGTAISYETAGTFDPWKKGPTTKWGEHRGLIQWGVPQRKQYGVTKDMPIGKQMDAVGRYLRDRGVKPGAGMIDVYSAINAGGVGKKYHGRTDAHAGGAPGTVADKVYQQMAQHRQKAANLIGSYQVPAQAQIASAPVNNQLAATQAVASQPAVVDIMGQQAMAQQQATQLAQQAATQQAASQQIASQQAAQAADPFSQLMGIASLMNPQPQAPPMISPDAVEPGIGGTEAMDPQQAVILSSHTPDAYRRQRRLPRIRI